MKSEKKCVYGTVWTAAEHLDPQLLTLHITSSMTSPCSASSIMTLGNSYETGQVLFEKGASANFENVGGFSSFDEHSNKPVYVEANLQMLPNIAAAPGVAYGHLFNGMIGKSVMICIRQVRIEIYSDTDR